MQFDAKFFTLLVFVVINFFILFIVKTRTSLVITVIIAHLVAVLFFSLSIENYAAFREITLALIVYSMVILFLISNYGSIVVDGVDEKKDKQNFIIKAATCFVASAIFLLLLIVVKNVSDLNKNTKIASNKDKQELSRLDNYPSIKTVGLQAKLEDNFLLKRSSDVILIIVAASTLLLLISKKEK